MNQTQILCGVGRGRRWHWAVAVLAVLGVGLGVSAGEVPAPTWGDVLRTAQGATTVRMTMEQTCWPEDLDPYVASRSEMVVQWPDRLRVDRHELAHGRTPENRSRTVADKDRSVRWDWTREATRRASDGALLATELKSATNFLALMGCAVVPAKDGTMKTLEVDAGLVMEVVEVRGEEFAGERWFRVPRSDGAAQGPAGYLAGTTAFQFAPDRNELVGLIWEVGYFSAVGVKIRVDFDPELPGDFFSMNDPAGVAWAENPTWGDMVRQIAGAKTLRLRAEGKVDAQYADAYANRRRVLVVAWPDALREDSVSSAYGKWPERKQRRVVTGEHLVTWNLTAATVERVQRHDAWPVAPTGQSEFLDLVGFPREKDPQNKWAIRVPDEARFERVAGTHPHAPGLRGFRLARDSHARTLKKPNARWPGYGVVYWFTADGKTLRRVVKKSGTLTWDIEVEMDPVLPEGFFALENPDVRAWTQVPSWSAVAGAVAEASAIRFATTRYERPSADEPFVVTARHDLTTRWPDRLRMDVHAVDHPESKAVRAFYLATATRGLDQVDDGTPGRLYNNSVFRFDELRGYIKEPLAALGLRVAKGADAPERFAVPGASRMALVNLKHPEDPSLRAFRVVEAGRAGNAAEALPKAALYWFADHGRRLVGYSPWYRRSADQLVYTAVEVDPQLPASFFKFERACGDWSY